MKLSKRSPDERSDIRGFFHFLWSPHIAARMRATCLFQTRATSVMAGAPIDPSNQLAPAK